MLPGMEIRLHLCAHSPTWVIPSTAPIIYYLSYLWSPGGETTPSINVYNSGSYSVSVSDGNGCTASSSPISVTVHPLPNASITANYCDSSRYIKLTAHPGGCTYLWNTGATNQTIYIDVVGIYSVTVTDGNGCSAIAYLPASNELVTDGSFTNFNPASPDFFTEYTQNQNWYTGVPTSGLWPEGYYAVNLSAWSGWPNPPQGYHPSFHGRDHTNNSDGPKNFMMVNGSTVLIGIPPRQRIIWQQIVNVDTNTNYYFSAWGMNLNPASPAQLQFEINGELNGSVADLGAPGVPAPTTEAQVNLLNWIRFYSTDYWNSGSATTAVIRIRNLNTVAGGNDFGLDDISFGTLDPPRLFINPLANGGSDLCEGDTLYLEANIEGGVAPYSFSWTGPDGFVSDLQNPIIPNVTFLNQGWYYLTVGDDSGCPSNVSDSTYLGVIPAPSCLITGNNLICPNSPGNIYTAPTGMSSYLWTIEGNGIISSSPHGPSVAVKAGLYCDSIFVLTLTITNGTGCDAMCAMTVMVNDVIPPVITCPFNTPQIVGVNVGNQYQHTGNSWNATATDNCAVGSLTAILTGATNSGPFNTLNGVMFNEGTTLVTWTAKDGCGNSVSCSFEVIVTGTCDMVVTKTGPAGYYCRAGHHLDYHRYQ